MTHELIPYLNGKLELTGYFQKLFGLCETITRNEIDFPAEYCANGEFKSVDQFDKYNGMGYWRKTADISMVEEESQVSCKKNLVFTIPLKFVAIIPRTKTANDNQYTDDRVLFDLVKELVERNGTIKQEIGAKRIAITVTSKTTDSKRVLESEYKGLNVDDFRHEYVYVQLLVTIQVITTKTLIVASCEEPCYSYL